MRGDDNQQEAMFSYVSPEKRVPADHPLRPIRKMVDEILKEMSPQFAKLYCIIPRWTWSPHKFDIPHYAYGGIWLYFATYWPGQESRGACQFSGQGPSFLEFLVLTLHAWTDSRRLSVGSALMDFPAFSWASRSS